MNERTERRETFTELETYLGDWLQRGGQAYIMTDHQNVIMGGDGCFRTTNLHSSTLDFSTLMI